MLEKLMDAAEDLGRSWRAATGDPEATLVTIASSRHAVEGRRSQPLEATEFLDNVWEALLAVYRGMAGLSGEERVALRPFSPLQPLVVVPLQCPAGVPPAGVSMLEVARFHDGALFRRLPVGESFWEVAPDLADSPAAAWALSSFLPADLR
ncbi:unnamed protein product, partial [Polarella glacialis]